MKNLTLNNIKMNWITFAILSSTCFGFYNLFAKISADKLSPTIALMFMATASFTIALIWTLFLKFTGHNLTITKSTLIFPIIAWLLTGVAEIFYLIMFSKNTPVSIGTPFVLSATLLITTILGILILKEGITTIKITGIIITLIGLIILTRS